MAISRVKTWSSGEVLTASDLNAEFNNILTNAADLVSPFTKAISLGGFALTLDALAVTSFVSSSSASFAFTSGAKTGTPATTGSVANWTAQTFTDSATAGSGTATAYVAHGFQRPTLAATNASVVTTDAATVYVANAPAAGTNETLTNSYVLWTDDGRVRHDLTATVVSAAGATLDAMNLPAVTATITGATNITTATGVNFVNIGTPTLSAASALTITNAATLYVAAAPTGAGAGPATITNAYALWVDSGAARFDGSVRIDGQLLGIGAPSINELRLTLTTAVPVTTSDVTGAGTLYWTPHVGSHIALYDGSLWQTFSTAEVSLALTLTSGKPYDIFGFISSGAPALEVLVWTNDTTRATALTRQDGVLVKTGATTRRYLGTLYSSGANTTEDSLAKRYLWNYYHRTPRVMRVVDSTASWNYTIAAYRQARATATNQLDYVQGFSEDPVTAEVWGLATNDTAFIFGGVGIGVDSTTVNSAQTMSSGTIDLSSVASRSPQFARYRGYPGVGRHTLPWLEYSTATGTTTWYGSADARQQMGIHGEVLA